MSQKQILLGLRSGEKIFIQGCAATPHRLVRQMLDEAVALKDLEVYHLHTEGEAPWGEPRFRDHLTIKAFFLGANLRAQFDGDHVDYIPCYLSEVANLFRRKDIALDVALVQVSPPDRHGFCSLGTSVDVSAAAVQSAKRVFAQINPNMPRVLGDGFVHVSRFDQVLHVEDPIFTKEPCVLSESEKKIGRFIADLVEDGSTLQTGIGSIPDAVCAELRGRKKLGLHTEMWSDGVLELIQSGVIDNSEKKIHPGKSISGFVVGSKRLYDFIDNNPSVLQLDMAYVNNPLVIAKNPKVVAINSAVEIDLTGQVCADSVGTRIISGVGGQMDFMRGALLSPGGKAILAMPSISAKGFSKIVPQLRPGAGVVTPRAQVQYVVTENGVVNLHGKSLKERAKALISIAHPSVQEELSRKSYEMMLKV